MRLRDCLSPFMQWREQLGRESPKGSQGGPQPIRGQYLFGSQSQQGVNYQLVLFTARWATSLEHSCWIDSVGCLVSKMNRLIRHEVICDCAWHTFIMCLFCVSTEKLGHLTPLYAIVAFLNYLSVSLSNIIRKSVASFIKTTLYFSPQVLFYILRNMSS